MKGKEGFICDENILAIVISINFKNAMLQAANALAIWIWCTFLDEAVSCGYSTHCIMNIAFNIPYCSSR